MHPHVMEVVVRGRLGADLVAALDGFEVEPGDQGMTRIVGPVSDQSVADLAHPPPPVVSIGCAGGDVRAERPFA